ncbi:MAG: hypothetical protein KAX28_04780 [Candidatus Marinimicrobia bacterium]|nr:hypothetical protein [Candidatus Neomarinimicrobiota bacterium]
MLDFSLRNRPIAIISSNQQNGTIISASKEATEEGLQKGLKVSLARKMSHSVVLLPYNSILYSKMHRYIYKTLSVYSPVIEPTVFGQYYIDMTGMDNIYKNNIQAGCLISSDIHSKANLNSLIGISTNKLVSRISTAVVPENIYKIEPGNEPRFLAPLQSDVLPSVQEKPVSRIIKFLFLHQVKNVQEVVSHSESGQILFGRHYQKIRMEANGQDRSIVKPPKLRNHIIEQTVLDADTNDEEILTAVVKNLAEQAAYQLRQRRQVSKSVTLEIHYTDGYKNARKGSLLLNDDKSATDVAVNLFIQANYRRNRIRSVLIDVTDLYPASTQLDIFRDERNNKLSATLDKIRKKYGFSSICTASDLMIPKAIQKKSSLPMTQRTNYSPSQLAYYE